MRDIKQNRFSLVYGYETKTSPSGDLIKSGYIATTHLDSGFYDDSKSAWVRDRITKETLTTWANEINEGNPRANKVSINHNRETHVAGVAIKGSARVDKLNDGEYGLYADTLVDKTKENFEDTSYRLEKGLLDSFSIEFTTKNMATGSYLKGAVAEIPSNGYIERCLLPGTILEGYTLASQPMNEHAVMIKEAMMTPEHPKGCACDDCKKKGMDKDSSDTDAPKAEDTARNPNYIEGSTGVDSKNSSLESTTVEMPNISTRFYKETGEIKLETKQEIVPPVEVKEQPPEVKETKPEVKQPDFKEFKDSIMAEVKEQLKSVKVEEKVQINKGEIKVETKEYTEYRKVLEGKEKMSIEQQFRAAGRFAESKGMFNGKSWETTQAEHREFKFTTNGKNLEFKGLGITTNQNSDTDYLLSAAELSDVFDPVIYNLLNQQTVTWNILPKDDYSNKGNNQVQFTVKTAANATSGAYAGNAVNTGNVTRLKYQTKFKKYQVGVEVDGDMIAAARGGPIGDVFAQEVKDSTLDLLSTINQALFAEVGLESAAGVIGFEYISDSAGNTTLYNVTRSAVNKLSPDSAGDTYIDGASVDITFAKLRSAKRQALKEGAFLPNLVFVTDHVQGDKLRGLYDDIQRLVPVSSRFGFEGMMSFDGIPIYEDKDCTDDNWHLLDLESVRVAIWVPPTLEMLGKDSDAQKGFIKTYFAVYYRRPRAISMIYDCATS